MTKVVVIRGFMFKVTLADGTTLCMRAGEEKTIKNSLVSESLKIACKQGIVSLSEVETTKPIQKDKTTGGASK